MYVISAISDVTNRPIYLKQLLQERYPRFSDDPAEAQRFRQKEAEWVIKQIRQICKIERADDGQHTS